jgi:hypothetical protein
MPNPASAGTAAAMTVSAIPRAISLLISPLSPPSKDVETSNTIFHAKFFVPDLLVINPC